ncbi:MAG: DUF2269 family protein [Coxiellaceae bacterium]|nr:DUF2269 family protein [Coxiellaceae bacterium]
MVWLTYFAKWLHLCLVLLLLGGLFASYGFTLAAMRSSRTGLRQQVVSLSCWGSRAVWVAMAVLAITGTLLVHPRGYTFQTPWINAAYLFLALAAFCLYVIHFLKQQLLNQRSASIYTLVFYHVLNMVLFITLIVIAYEAVSKQTFLRFS